MARELDVATLIRNFVDLSLRLNRPGQEPAKSVSAGPLNSLNPVTLRFRDPRLELVYYTFCGACRTAWRVAV